MPQLSKQIKSEDVMISFWNITENIDELKKMLFPFLDVCEMEQFSKISNEHRQKEWITSRLLLKNMLGNYEKIYYNHNRKPYIETPFTISISHSKEYLTILLTKKKMGGIDLEKISPKIAKIAYKFLCNEEITQIEEKEKIPALYVNWCTKEAIYKAYGKRDISFRENIFINAFNYKNAGTINANLKFKKTNKEFKVHYFEFTPEYLVAWCVS